MSGVRGAYLLFPFIALLALSIIGVLWFQYGWELRSTRFIDAKSFWLGVRVAFIEGLIPYGQDFQNASEATPGGYAHPYVYPPPSLLLLAPLGAMDYEAATIALLVASHVALLLLVVGVAQSTLGTASLKEPWSLALIVVIGALIGLSFGSRVSLGHGQVNYFVLCGIVWFWAACIGRAWRWTGAFGLVVAGLLKPYFGIFALFLLFPVGRRLLVPFIVISSTLLALSVAILPTGTWSAWVSNALGELVDGELYLGQYPIYSETNHALRSAVDALIGHFTGAGSAVWRDAQLIVAFTMLTVQLLAMWTRRTARYAQTVPAMALLPLVFLLSPVSWPHYGLYSAVSAGVLLAFAYSVQAPLLGAVAAGCLCMLLHPPAIANVTGLPEHSIMGIVSVILWSAAMAWSLTKPSSMEDLPRSAFE